MTSLLVCKAILYRQPIHFSGEVILDKVQMARTVVNKVNSIDNEYRNFQMELIGGEEDYTAKVKREGLQYEFDYSKVFWNTRLGKSYDEAQQHCKPLTS